jgi:hypothetical protein
MIKLMYEKSGQYFIITIENKVIKYWDKFEGKVWGTSLQYLPPDHHAKEKIVRSRNKIPMGYLKLLEIPKDELKEFEVAKDDNELKELVVRDCKKNGCKLIDTKET